MAGGVLSLTLKYGSRSFVNAAQGVEQFRRDLGVAWAGTAKKASPAVRAYLDHVAQDLAETHGGAWSPNQRGDSEVLLRRSGKAVNSILRSVRVTGTTWSTLKGVIGGVGYLYVHEYGGTIKKTDGMMAIPLPAALTSSGMKRTQTRHWKNTFVAMSRNGNLIIFQRRGTGRTRHIVPLYLLRSSVKIRPRLGMRRELERQIPYFLEQAADLIVSDVIKQMG